MPPPSRGWWERERSASGTQRDRLARSREARGEGEGIEGERVRGMRENGATEQGTEQGRDGAMKREGGAREGAREGQRRDGSTGGGPPPCLPHPLSTRTRTPPHRLRPAARASAAVDRLARSRRAAHGAATRR